MPVKTLWRWNNETYAFQTIEANGKGIPLGRRIERNNVDALL